MPITSTQIAAIILPKRYQPEKLNAITLALNTTFERYAINTPLRMCHFLAQVLHESSAFHYSVEIWGNTPAQLGYDTRVDLGNTPEHDGDGYRYRGRGWIQVTGRANYKLVSQELGKDFIADPDLLATEPYDSLSAGWFWNRRKFNTFADLDDILSITKRVNGGYNGLDDRKMWLVKAKNVLMK
jgi:putative chitinase